MSVCLAIVEKAKKGRLKRRRDCYIWDHGMIASLLWLLSAVSLCLLILFLPVSVMSPHKTKVMVWKGGDVVKKALVRHKNSRLLSECDLMLWG